MSRRRKRSRLPLAVAMGTGLAAAAAGAGLAVAKRSAARHRNEVDERASDLVAFDLDALGVTHHRIPTHDGGELHVVEKGPADARPLVLLHGILLQSRVWGYQLRDLSDRWRVIALDLRGFGESRPGAEGFGLGPLARDLRMVLEALDVRDAVVMGHSMGGMTVMRFCGDHPDALDDRVAGVVFLATAPVLPFPPGVQRAFRRLAPALARRGWQRMPSHSVLGADVTYTLTRRTFGRRASPFHVELIREMVASVPGSTSWPTGIGLAGHDAEAALSATRTPALVIGGELDRLLPAPLSERIASYLPDCELHILADAGHELMLERPDEVAELLDRFAKKLAG